MATFNDLAIELQEAIWELVLPTARGVHWVELEGIPHGPESVRDSIRLSKSCDFYYLPGEYHMPESCSDIDFSRSRFKRLAKTENKESSAFFRHLITTVPAVFGQAGMDDDTLDKKLNGNLPQDLMDEIADTHRCRKLSTYFQIGTLLSICRLSRQVAERYIQRNSDCSWPIHRSMGSLYCPRPIDAWEAQYSEEKTPLASVDCHQVLRPQIHALDLVVIRLHDSYGRPTPQLRHGPWQFFIERSISESSDIGCFARIGLEYHPSWHTLRGLKTKLRSGNVWAILSTMPSCYPPFNGFSLYWLVDGMPRPDWKHDYPAEVEKLFTSRIAEDKRNAQRHLERHWELTNEEKTAMLADYHLDQEFEANGRRYYIVFVVYGCSNMDDEDALNEAGLDHFGPFIGSEEMWPEVIREQAWLAQAAGCRYILSWEPIQ